MLDAGGTVYRPVSVGGVAAMPGATLNT